MVRRRIQQSWTSSSLHTNSSSVLTVRRMSGIGGPSCVATKKKHATCNIGRMKKDKFLYLETDAFLSVGPSR